MKHIDTLKKNFDGPCTAKARVYINLWEVADGTVIRKEPRLILKSKKEQYNNPGILKFDSVDEIEEVIEQLQKAKDWLEEKIDE